MQRAPVIMGYFRRSYHQRYCFFSRADGLH
ncbi:hypothetical protein XFF6166_1000067 [Xanthomonas citri pv. fuscans]|uniref:Transposase n=1 Tax=Xanthomonas campestris pv. phaseoli TaxID=317013 RepID=A0AB38DUH0_XANCH|nr:hypothetical protein XFF6166_1000067 [Xanthomonas citri pv. fuscans]SON75097.1 hypothetical protein XAP412_1070003 [Xanthomonas phaseoli pv. phaseoli]SON76062.1 hypothetical protein XAP6984_1120003 [Xanthomonas phaseoli pv. phaseoli]SON78782.1 hypothetical protein XAP7430_1090003 [Xanthomonas phaseoli pv. phaseoli]SOO02646.1 hypothetical protein XFF7767_1150005 [Xanthomonas citri pv. fuscans]